MARNVYLVYSIDLDDERELERVFSSREKANNFIELYKRITPYIEYEVVKEELF